MPMMPCWLCLLVPGCIVCELLTPTALLQCITTLACSYYFVGQSIVSADKNNHSVFICPLGLDGPGCLFQFIFGILRKVSRRKTFRYSNTHTGSFGVCINDCFPPKLPMLKFSSRMIELLLAPGGSSSKGTISLCLLTAVQNLDGPHWPFPLMQLQFQPLSTAFLRLYTGLILYTTEYWSQPKLCKM